MCTATRPDHQQPEYVELQRPVRQPPFYKLTCRRWAPRPPTTIHPKMSSLSAPIATRHPSRGVEVRRPVRHPPYPCIAVQRSRLESGFNFGFCFGIAPTTCRRIAPCNIGGGWLFHPALNIIVWFHMRQCNPRTFRSMRSTKANI